MASRTEATMRIYLPDDPQRQCFGLHQRCRRQHAHGRRPCQRLGQPEPPRLLLTERRDFVHLHLRRGRPPKKQYRGRQPGLFAFGKVDNPDPSQVGGFRCHLRDYRGVGVALSVGKECNRPHFFLLSSPFGPFLAELSSLKPPTVVADHALAIAASHRVVPQRDCLLQSRRSDGNLAQVEPEPVIINPRHHAPRPLRGGVEEGLELCPCHNQGHRQTELMRLPVGTVIGKRKRQNTAAVLHGQDGTNPRMRRNAHLRHPVRRHRALVL